MLVKWKTENKCILLLGVSLPYKAMQLYDPIILRGDIDHLECGKWYISFKMQSTNHFFFVNYKLLWVDFFNLCDQDPPLSSQS